MYHKGKYFIVLIFCDCDLQTGISREINSLCANVIVLLNHCLIPVAVSTRAIVLRTCLNDSIFKLPEVHQRKLSF